MFKVRFNLSAGDHFQKWQVKCGPVVNYYDPADVCIVMTDCKLKNRAATALKIHAGEHKSVCAWIDCDDVEIVENSIHSGLPICYNPKKLPYWTDVTGRRNLDNYSFHKIVSVGRSLKVV